MQQRRRRLGATRTREVGPNKPGAKGRLLPSGKDHPLRPAVGLDHPDEALVAEAVHHLGKGAALELEGLGQRQDREVGALRGGCEDDHAPLLLAGGVTRHARPRERLGP